MSKQQGRSYNRRDFVITGTASAAAAGMSTTKGWTETLAAPSQSRAAQPSGNVQHEIVRLRAQDGGNSRGVFYRRADSNPQVAVVTMHPVGDSTLDWRAEMMAQQGMAFFGMAGRYASNERHHIHEEILLDVAAGVKHLKEERGIRTIILLGHSGGGQLMVFYHSQATTSPPNRIPSTPAGGPPNLNDYEMLPADSLIMSSSHPGRSIIFRNRLDPSVVDESDPFSRNPDLDMYDPRNGFRRGPESSKYSEDFIKRYREGQHARMERLDAKARSMIAEENFYQGLMQAGNFQQRPLEEQLDIERRATHCHWMTFRRVQADLRWSDLSLEPSDRIVRSGGPYEMRPDRGNYSIHRRPQIMSPRAFLSSRSSISSNSRVWDKDRYSGALQILNLSKVFVPMLVICGTADQSVAGLEQQRNLLEASRSRDKSIVWIVGADHGYNPSGPKAGNGGQREEAVERMVQWIRERYNV